MRWQMVLMALALTFSSIIWISVATTQERPNNIDAIMHIQPDALFLKEGGHGKWITAIIKLPKRYDVDDINMSSVVFLVKETKKNVPWSTYEIQGNILTVRFDRAFVTSEVRDWFEPLSVHMSPHVKIELTFEVIGKLYDSAGSLSFKGRDTIRVFITQY